MKRVKLVFENKIRKFEVPAEQSHAHVNRLIQKTTANRGFIPVLQYEDEDHDWITIGTEADLALCLQTNETPKIYIFKPQDAVNQRNKIRKAAAAEPNDGWVRFGFEADKPPSESPVLVQNPAAMETDEPSQSARSSAPVPPGPAPTAAPMDLEDEKEKKEDPTQQPDNTLPFDWNLLVEDFLTNTRALGTLTNEVYTAVQNGGDLKSAVMRGLDKEPFKSHPFVKAGKPDFERMLGKVNHMSVLLLQIGKNGIEMAVPILARGFAKMKMGGSTGMGGMVDMAPVFAQIAPGMTKWLRSGLRNDQEATFDMGKVLRMMAEGGPRPRGGEADGEPDEPAPTEDPEVAAAAKDGIVLHKGITCDVCEEKPIIGIRYKCMVCPDFDMCEECHNKGVHPAEHALVAMKKPAPRGGFAVGKGHYKGAAEMFRGPWQKWGGGGKCGWGHKRRAQKKLWKWKKHCGQAQSENGSKQEEGVPNHTDPMPHHPFHGPGRHRWGGRGRHHHGGFHGPAPWEKHAGTFAAPPPPHQMHEAPAFMTPGYDSDSSSSSSSSSDSERGMDAPPKHHKGSQNKRKKSKKRMKRLTKRQKKVRKRIEKLTYRQHKIHRKLSKLHHKEQKLNRVLRDEHNVMRVSHQGPPPANQPGHDPNPNRGRDPNPNRGMPWAFHHGQAWPFHPNAGPFGPPAPPAPVPAPAKRDDYANSKRDDYASQLALLIEMGFDDVPTLKRLLKETKGDVKSVIAIVMSRKGYGKIE